MDNEKSSRSPQGIRKILLVLGIGLALTLVLALILKNNKIVNPNPIANQESFQGPAEISAALQNTCQESADRVLKIDSCDKKKDEYLQNIESCAQAYVSIDGSTEPFEGNFGDLAIKVSDCYQKKSDYPHKKS